MTPAGDNQLKSKAILISVAAVLSLLPGGAAQAQPGGAARAQPADGGPISITESYPAEKAILRPRRRYQRLDRERGLPQNTVNAIVQDRTGFMWLGTEDGLARYDGQRFKTFRSSRNDPTSISASFVNALLVAKDGTMWVGTEGGGVNRYHPDSGTFDRFLASDQPDHLTTGSVSSLAEGPDGLIWVGTRGGGVGILDPATGKVRTYSKEDGLPEAVNTLLVDPQNVGWIGSVAGLYRFDLKKPVGEALLQDHESLKQANITALMRDKAGDFWVGTDGQGMVRYTPSSGKVQVFRADVDDVEKLADDKINVIFQDSHGVIWVGNNTFLNAVDPATGRFERHGSVDVTDTMSLFGFPRTMYEDADGVVWFGTTAGGASLVDPRSTDFVYYRTPGVSGLYTKGKDIWITTFEGVCRYRSASILIGECWKLGFATAALVDRSGVIWVGTYNDGLFKHDPKAGDDKWTVYPHVPGAPTALGEGAVLRLQEDRAGNVWIGLLGGGLQRYDRRSNGFVSYSVGSSSVASIEVDPKDDNVIWAGTIDAGIARVNIDGTEIRTYKPVDEPENNSDNNINDFTFDGPGTIWAATYGGGLKRLDLATGKFTTWSQAEGLPSPTTYSVLKDRTGKLWVSSIAGLARLDPASKQVSVFTAADGLQSLEFSQGVRSAMDDGRLVFGGINGFNVFKPEDIKIDQRPPPLVVTSIEVLGDPFSPGRSPSLIKTIDLEHDEGFLTVDFAALSFSGSDQYQFEYKIEGLNDRWFRTDRATVSLTGLKTGDYTLHLRARNRHGLQSQPVQIQIAVAPPFYLTWWAFASYGVILLGVLLGVWRYQKARTERLQKMARLASVERDLEVTAAVQTWFLPETNRYHNGAIDLVGFYRGAEKCSGDWWWYETLDQGRLWVIVADVTGHGAGPAMLTAAVAMGMSVQAKMPQENPIERLTRVNQEVLSRCKGKATMTMTAVLIDQHSGNVVIHGMGGLPAVLVNPQGKYTVIATSGTPIGSVENLSIGERKLRMESGDRLLITTDGIVETTLTGGRQLGFRRFVNVVRGAATMPLEPAADHIVREVDVARGSNKQEDDFTFCIVERHAP